MSSQYKKHNDNFLVQGSILAITSILVRIIGLVYRVPMARILGNEGIGYYGYAFEIYNFCFIISSYGMPMAVSKLVSEKTAKREYNNAWKILIGALIVSIISGGLLSAGVYFGAGFIATHMFANPAIQIPLKALAPTVLVSAVLGVIRGFFQGKGTMVPTALSQFFEQIINGIVSVWAAFTFAKSHSASLDIAAHGAAGGVTGTFAGTLFGLIIIYLLLILNIPTLKRQRLRDKSEPDSMPYLIKIILATVVPVMLSQILVRSNGLISMTLFNNILHLKGMAKEAYTSLYGIYEGKFLLLCNIVMGITSAITTASIPSLVRGNILSTKKEVEKKVRLALKFNLMIAIPSTVGLAILGAPIIRLLFGDTDPIIEKIMLIGSGTIALYTVSILFSTIIQSIYSMVIPVIINMIAMLIDIAFIFLLLKYTDTAVLALVLGGMLMPAIVIVLSFLIIRFRLHIRIEIFKTCIIPSVASGIMGVLVYFVYNITTNLSGKYYFGLMAALPIGIFTFFVFELLLKGISKTELKNFPGGRSLIRLAVKMHLMR
ncbi:MAG: putative polysaccharide biosynthesis protein [Catonella sp.]|uniref:putative polysaccharide biosynthesis protein n=1 Tax=Catonella sp. TaxID=2382125 RepID=UPI003F9ED61A